jgi:DNA-binding GntR family transcriptional regulator
MMLKETIPRATRPGPDEDEIVERIYSAVMEQRLPPGTKLGEVSLAEAFGVGRARIRRSLLILAGREIVELEANRGAFVARPSAEQARDIFQVRRTVEPTVARLAIARMTADDLRALGAHLDAEAEANRAGDRRRAIRLSGRFHVILAEVARNHVFERLVKELVARTSLILGMFGARGMDNCRFDEHGRLLVAMRDRDAARADALMLEHLTHIEAGVEISSRRPGEVDLVRLFAE